MKQNGEATRMSALQQCNRKETNRRAPLTCMALRTPSDSSATSAARPASAPLPAANCPPLPSISLGLGFKGGGAPQEEAGFKEEEEEADVALR